MFGFWNLMAVRNVGSHDLCITDMLATGNGTGVKLNIFQISVAR